jgi:CHAT domain-containing protein
MLNAALLVSLLWVGSADAGPVARVRAHALMVGPDEVAWSERRERRDRRAVALAERGWTSPHPQQARAHLRLGYLLDDQGALEDALAHIEAALAIADALPAADWRLQLEVMGFGVEMLLAVNELERALALSERRLAVAAARREEAPGEYALAVHDRGLMLLEAGRAEAALAPLREAEGLYLALEQPPEEDLAWLALDIGDTLQVLDHHLEATEVYAVGRARVARALGEDHPMVAHLAVAEGSAFHNAGQVDRALALMREGLALAERGSDEDIIDNARLTLGVLLMDLGDLEGAVALFEQALAGYTGRRSPDPVAEGIMLNELGDVYRLLGDTEGALGCYQRSVSLQTGALGVGHENTAVSQRRLASLYTELGRYQEARALLEQALETLEAALGPAHSKVGLALLLASQNERAAGQPEAAARYLQRALGIAVEGGEAYMEWQVFSYAMEVAIEDHQPAAAALWGKLAVKTLQELRDGLGESDTSLRESFRERHGEIYRDLAGALAEQGRLAEAEEVLALLKEDEHQRYLEQTRGGGGEVSLTPEEAALLDTIRSQQRSLVADLAEYKSLRRAKLTGELSPEQEARLAELTELRRASKEAMDTTFEGLREELEALDRGGDWEALGTERLSRLQARLPGGAVLVHAVVLPERLLLMLTTPEAQLSRQVEVEQGTLNKELLALRQALMDPTTDPRPAAQGVYDRLLRPLEDELDQAGATTLLLYLDGALRYVPIAALHDGQQFVAQRWATAVYTPAAEAELTRPPAEDPVVAAYGASLGGEVAGHRLSPLVGVPDELDAIVLDGPDDEGAIAGRAYLDAGFTAGALADSLELGVPWIHIASHFQFQPGGTDADSYLLLGDGSALSVRDLRNGDFPLNEVDLLAFSACETALSDQRGDGSEVEGLAVVAQNGGAAAVLATLWSVDDRSTAAWMADFYAKQAADPLPRAAAVQRIQRAFLEGQIAPDTDGEAQRGGASRAPKAADPAMPGWQHPYYWAPFVLFGVGS